MNDLLLIFSAVFVLNIIPAFAPPTWMAMTVIGFNNAAISPLLLALVAALAAVCGRLTLAKLSEVLVRNRWLSRRTRQNIDVLKDMLERHQKATVGVLLLYAFSPFPTNYLFIAYGLTALPLRLIAIPFVIGRFVSYAFWIVVAQTAAERLNPEIASLGSYFGGYFVLTQILLLAVVYLFTRIDWRKAVVERKFGFLKRTDDAKDGER